MSQKEDLLKKIKEKKSLLASTSKASESWRGGNYKTSGVTQNSKMSILLLKKEIKELSNQINNLNK